MSETSTLPDEPVESIPRQLPDEVPPAINRDVRDRNIRYRDLMPPTRLSNVEAVIVGVGAIGRQLATQLAAIGVPRLILIDFDKVSAENLGTQGYHEADLGKLKVDCTANMCRSINPAIVVATISTAIEPNMLERYDCEDRLFASCVDKMDVRKMIWEGVQNQVGLFIDGRMAAEVLRVLTAELPDIDKYYEKTLFTQDEAFAESCTQRSTLYTASIAAGFLVRQFSFWLRGVSPSLDYYVNLVDLSIDIIKDTDR